MHEKLTQLLLETDQEYDRAHSDANKSGSDWALWYSEYLLEKTSFSEFVGVTYDRTTLTHLLTNLDGQFQAEHIDVPWAEYYAQHLAG